MPRRGLDTHISTDALRQLIGLPDDYVIGTAIADGGCFFDALAQALNAIQHTNAYIEKFLRALCHQRFLELRAFVDALNQTDATGPQGEDYAFIQYATAKLNRDFPNRNPIWGRSEIEGRLLCQALGLANIQVIELQIDPATLHILPSAQHITANGSYSQETIVYDAAQPTLLVGWAHYVPILPRAAESVQQAGTPLTKRAKREVASASYF